ncbi:TIGR03759 family integrating conjugative element protein [Congregibacter litoralis]|uniref:Integrating conjugative element protein family n=1 Tax=Congregibacter litoralis KT71 TaxID=314285 RepID=A4AE30_9GAMM|nr:TIGR03759 family integrating conjugative element protein [Congregibacter litoralis]EAQ95722.1 integrating conjugative element protein family [Congregibacter litoralis KT71]
MINARNAGLIVALLLGAGISEGSDPSQTAAVRTGTHDSGVLRTPLTEQERTRAAYWRLSESEWRRYRSLMDGIRGNISPSSLSPIEALGIHARDDAERQRYAEQWATLMREDAKRVLAFQQAYDTAGQRLFPAETLIDYDRLPDPTAKRDALWSHDRLLLFLRLDCRACEAVLARALARIDQVAGVDVFLIGIAADDDAAIRAWASDRGIRPDWVNAQRVTLNFGDSVLERIAPHGAEIPLIVRRRGDTLTLLDRGSL